MGIVTHRQESTELGSSTLTMRSLLVVALFALARGNPQFLYTVGHHTPYVFTNGHTSYHSTPSQPLSYVRPQLYANNACRNTLGQLVPCALPSIAGSSVYAYNSVPNTGFVQAAAGVAAIPAQVDADMPPAPEAPAAPAVTTVKREAEAAPEAEADPYYYFGRVGAYGYPGYYHPYFYGHQGWGCRNAAGTLVPCAHYVGKREAEAEPEAKPEANAEADPYYYLGHNYAGYYGAYLPYYYGYHGVGCRNTYGALVPCAGK